MSEANANHKDDKENEADTLLEISIIIGGIEMRTRAGSACISFFNSFFAIGLAEY